MSIYNNCTVSELQHFVIDVANTEGGKILRVHTHNSFKMLDFHRSSHICTLIIMGGNNICMQVNNIIIYILGAYGYSFAMVAC